MKYVATQPEHNTIPQEPSSGWFIQHIKKEIIHSFWDFEDIALITTLAVLMHSSNLKIGWNL
jgi:hypothetical protein